MAKVDPRQAVFLDETSTSPAMTPVPVRAPRGERVVGRVPWRRWRHVTLAGTVTPQGMGPSLVIDGAAGRLVFDAFVEQVLAPSLRPGQTVVLDNPGVHKSAAARERIEAAGCLDALPADLFPDFNPIEQAFARIKTLPGRTETRTFDDLVDAIRTGLDAITAADARALYRDAGYPSTEQLFMKSALVR